MKFNKKILNMMSAIAFAALLAGCSSKTDLHVYEYPGYDSTTVFDYTGDVYNIDEAADTGTEPLQNRKIVFLGTEYDLNYDSTGKKEFYPYFEDEYYAVDNQEMKFSFVEDGGFSGVTCHDGIKYAGQEPLTTEDDFSGYADSIMQSYIKLDDYVKTCSTSVHVLKKQGDIADSYIENYDYFYVSSDPDESPLYRYIYVRQYNGFDTFETAYVTLDPHGNIYNLHVNAAGMFDSVTAPAADMSVIDSAVSEKLESICKDGYTVKKVTNKVILCVDRDGGLFYVVGSTADIEDTSGHTETGQSNIFIITAG